MEFKKMRTVANVQRVSGEALSDLHKNRLLILLCLVAAAAVLLPIFFGEPRDVAGQEGGDSWRNVIYDFQTLIGGGAAIIAAWYTVRQMRISDRESERRHRELVGLQLRADRLKVERLLFPALGDLEVIYEAIAKANLSAAETLISTQPSDGRYMIECLNRDCNDALAILNRKQFQAALDLFDGDLAFRYGKTVDQLLNLRGACAACINEFFKLESVNPTMFPDVVERMAQDVKETLGQIKKYRRDLLIDFADMNVCLEHMKREYEIH